MYLIQWCLCSSDLGELKLSWLRYFCVMFGITMEDVGWAFIILCKFELTISVLIVSSHIGCGTDMSGNLFRFHTCWVTGG